MFALAKRNNFRIFMPGWVAIENSIAITMSAQESGP